MKQITPKMTRWQGGLIMIIGAAFLGYQAHPVATESVAQWSKVLVVSVGIPLALVNIGIVLWAMGTILMKIEEAGKNREDRS